MLSCWGDIVLLRYVLIRQREENDRSVIVVVILSTVASYKLRAVSVYRDQLMRLERSAMKFRLT